MAYWGAVAPEEKNWDILCCQCVVLLFIKIQLTTLTGYVQHFTESRRKGMSIVQYNQGGLTGKFTSWVGPVS